MDLSPKYKTYTYKISRRKCSWLPSRQRYVRNDTKGINNKIKKWINWSLEKFKTSTPQKKSSKKMRNTSHTMRENICLTEDCYAEEKLL